MIYVNVKLFLLTLFQSLPCIHNNGCRFTPDFTMSQIQRMLTVHTSLGPPGDKANYSLQAKVPYDLLSECMAVLPRPRWEPPLFYLIILFIGFLFFISMMSAYCESNKVLADYLRRRSKANTMAAYEKGKVFDLKSYNNMMSNSAGGCFSSGNNNNQAGKVCTSHSNSSNFVTNGKPSLLNGHEDAGRERSNSGHSNSGNNVIPQQTPQPLNSSSRRRSFLGSLSHIIKSFAVFRFFNSSKKPQYQNNTGQDKDKTSPSPSPNALRVQNPLKEASDTNSLQSNHSFNPSIETVNNSSSTSPVQNSAILSEKSIPNGCSTNSASLKSRKGKLNHRKQIVPDNSGSDSVPIQEALPRKSSKKDATTVEVSQKKTSASAMDDFDELTQHTKSHSSFANNIDGLDDFDLKDISLPKSGESFEFFFSISICFLC